MCGIVGFLDKRGDHEAGLGRTLLGMLRALGCRGPDSAGVAVFGPHRSSWALHLKLPERLAPVEAVPAVLEAVKDCGAVRGHQVAGGCLRLELVPGTDPAGLEDRLTARVPGCEIVSLGHRLELVKQVGSPDRLEETFHVSRMGGTHGIGHTRLSTESRVDLSHSQPFWAHGVPDLATVHNGHVTNYHKLRRRYEQRGYRFWTENDSEVIGVYLRDRMATGLSLEDALRSSLDDLDGSFSYLAASGDALAFVKDRFGFKPLVLAETDAFVALATEEVGLRRVLGDSFVAREPAPGSMQIWKAAEHTSDAHARSWV